MEQRPVKMVLSHLLEGPGDGALLGGEPAVEVDLVFPFEMPADERRVGDKPTIVLDIGQLALWRLAEAFGIGPIRLA
jgi:hypothetical protein